MTWSAISLIAASTALGLVSVESSAAGTSAINGASSVLCESVLEDPHQDAGTGVSDPVAQVEAAQLEVFDQIFAYPRTDADWTLGLDGPVHEPLTHANGTTASGEQFELEALLASNLDFSTANVTPEAQQYIDDHNLQLSAVFGWMRSGSLSVPVSGFVQSIDSEDDDGRQHDLLIVSVLDEDTILALEYLAVFGPAGNTPCDGIPFDGEFQACADLVNTNGQAAWDSLRQDQVIGNIGIGVGGGILCGLTGGIACPGVIGAMIGYNACIASSLLRVRNEWMAAMECCCIAQEARNNGVDGAPSPTECESTADWGSACGISF